FFPVDLDPANTNVENEQDDSEFKQGFPEVARLESLLPIVGKRIERRYTGLENLAAAALGQAPQQVQVRFGRIELGRIIDAGAYYLRAAQLSFLEVHQIEQIRADLLGWEARLVMARPG